MPHVFNSAEVQFWTALRFWLKFCQLGKIKGWKRPEQLLSLNKAPVGTKQAPGTFVFLLTPVPLPVWGYLGLHVSILPALARRLDKKSEACLQLTACRRLIHLPGAPASVRARPNASREAQRVAGGHRLWEPHVRATVPPQVPSQPLPASCSPSPVPPEPSLQLGTVMPNLHHTIPSKSCSQRVTKPSEVCGTLQFPCWWAPAGPQGCKTVSSSTQEGPLRRKRGSRHLGRSLLDDFYLSSDFPALKAIWML